MAVIGPEPFFTGVRAGIERAARYDLRAPDLEETLDETFVLALESLQRSEASGRFHEFFGEMVAVAVIARRAYGEPPLTSEGIDAYLRVANTFFNSFRHP